MSRRIFFILLSFSLLCGALSLVSAEEMSTDSGSSIYWSQTISSGLGGGSAKDSSVSPLVKSGFHSFFNHENLIDFGGLINDTDFGVVSGFSLVQQDASADLMPFFMTPYMYLQNNLRFRLAREDFRDPAGFTWEPFSSPVLSFQPDFWQISAGGGFDVGALSMLHYVNNAPAFRHADASLTASVQAALNFSTSFFSWKPLYCSLQAVITSSLVSIYNTYPYAPSIPPQDNTDWKVIFDHYAVAGIPNAWKTRTEVNLSIHLDNGHSVSFGYLHNLYNFKKIDIDIQGGSSLFSLGYTIPFSKPETWRYAR
ncbi:MAG: hypothetical protein K9L24_02120 [Spirochaetia bacterium]|nr:hypothetical protein [Spirochaetia bacterium]MCF7953606.1 hypothetical protein [Spirochaetales bacterium]